MYLSSYEKKPDTLFFAGYAGSLVTDDEESSNGKGFSGADAVTKTEIPLVTAGYSPAKTDAPPTETLVSPIPDDAPAVPKQFSTCMIDGKKESVSAQWTYRDAQNKELCHIFRFDPEGGKKQFRPLTLWKTDKGMEWKGKAPSDPRPLYGLDRLAAMSDADVVVCEGEKSADAAAHLFPDWVAVTSMNGSQSPNKTDWSPLAGRCVYLWADNDQPGADYIAEVERLATEAGATVKGRVSLDWFRQIRGEIGTPCDELPAGWDAADALSDGFTAENI
jgi:hypothetical protein